MALLKSKAGLFLAAFAAMGPLERATSAEVDRRVQVIRSEPCQALLKKASFFGRPLNDWMSVSRTQVATLAANWAQQGVQFQILDHGPFESLVITDEGDHPANQLARALRGDKGGLQLLTTPVLYMVMGNHSGPGAAYMGYEGQRPELPSVPTVDTDLLLLAKVAGVEHSLNFAPLSLGNLSVDAPLMGHELDHAGLSGQRRVSGPDFESIEGKFPENYRGPSHFGFLRTEEMLVKLRDHSRVTERMSLDSVPRRLSDAAAEALSLWDVPANDSQRLAILESLSHEVRMLGQSASEVGDAFLQKPPQAEFVRQRNFVWARFIVNLKSPSGDSMGLPMVVPLRRSRGLDDANNLRLLRDEMLRLAAVGEALQQFGEFSLAFIAALDRGEFHRSYANWIRYLRRLTSFDSLMKADGTPRTFQEYADEILR